jgi:hypothetical protein
MVTRRAQSPLAMSSAQSGAGPCIYWELSILPSTAWLKPAAQAGFVKKGSDHAEYWQIERVAYALHLARK